MSESSEVEVIKLRPVISQTNISLRFLSMNLNVIEKIQDNILSIQIFVIIFNMTKFNRYKDLSKRFINEQQISIIDALFSNLKVTSSNMNMITSLTIFLAIFFKIQFFLLFFKFPIYY